MPADYSAGYESDESETVLQEQPALKQHPSRRGFCDPLPSQRPEVPSLFTLDRFLVAAFQLGCLVLNIFFIVQPNVAHLLSHSVIRDRAELGSRWLLLNTFLSDVLHEDAQVDPGTILAVMELCMLGINLLRLARALWEIATGRDADRPPEHSTRRKRMSHGTHSEAQHRTLEDRHRQTQTSPLKEVWSAPPCEGCRRRCSPIVWFSWRGARARHGRSTLPQGAPHARWGHMVDSAARGAKGMRYQAGPRAGRPGAAPPEGGAQRRRLYASQMRRPPIARVCAPLDTWGAAASKWEVK